MKRLMKLAPSISAASFCSPSSDWRAVSRISVAKGSHCQATMMMMESSGNCANQSTGCRPKKRDRSASTP
ncbi:hypothetical protein D3C71_1885540 [compost metagenome]